MTAQAAPEPALPRRRHAAGEDPEKRAQIIEGARKVFMEQGYDAASMNQICQLAGVSKGTLYVYFQDKADLFIAFIETARDRMFSSMSQLLEGPRPLQDKLTDFGMLLARTVCSNEVIRAQRIIIGMAERMPELSGRFYDSGTGNRKVLTRLLEQESREGRLQISDPSHCAQQFIELVTVGLWRARLFGKDQTPPDEQTIASVVGQAVSMFLAAYAPRG